MINLRLLLQFFDSRFIRNLLIIAALIGFAVLIDMVVFMQIVLYAGPWMAMAILSVLSAIGILLSYKIVATSGSRLSTSIEEGVFLTDGFAHYLTSLLAAIFLTIPGFISTFCGLAILIPPISSSIGRFLSRVLGIDWDEAYEYLRLETLGHK